MTTSWTSEDVRRIDLTRASRVPALARIDRSGLASGRVYWDMWPVQGPDGLFATIGGRELWMALSAPERTNPSLRHFEAKIRFIERSDGQWLDRGDVLPDLPVPYEREWAGSAMFDGHRLHLYFTGAGDRDVAGGFQQRLFESHATIGADGMPTIWTNPAESVRATGEHYMPADRHEGEAGKIKAFRDPSHFRDPADGAEYLLFTASLAGSTSDFNGAVGIARRDAHGWRLLPPLIHADGVNNELERAHVVFRDGRYYLFWVTQRVTFAPDLRRAPTGLYGMVADTLFGEYRPLNGSGLVLSNPEDEPSQTYSWFVAADFQVSSFVDFWGLDGAAVPQVAEMAARHFGGVPAPLLQLAVDGEKCGLVAPTLE